MSGDKAEKPKLLTPAAILAKKKTKKKKKKRSSSLPAIPTIEPLEKYEDAMKSVEPRAETASAGSDTRKYAGMTFEAAAPKPSTIPIPALAFRKRRRSSLPEEKTEKM